MVVECTVDKMVIRIFLSYFSTKTYIVDTHQKNLTEALLMSAHKICQCGEIREKNEQFLVEKKFPLTLVLLNLDTPCLCKQCRSNILLPVVRFSCLNRDQIFTSR